MSFPWTTQADWDKKRLDILTHNIIILSNSLDQSFPYTPNLFYVQLYLHNCLNYLLPSSLTSTARINNLNLIIHNAYTVSLTVILP